MKKYAYFVIILLIVAILVVFNELDTSKNSNDARSKNIKTESGNRFTPTDCSKESNKDNCYWNNALGTLDSSHCEKIKIDDVFISKDTCYSIIASKKEDKSLCVKISDSTKKSNCNENLQ